MSITKINKISNIHPMNLINGYEFGRIVVGDKNYTSDVIIASDRVINQSWWRREGHRVSKHDIGEILDYSPEIVIFGTGYNGLVRIDREVEDFLREKGIDVEKLKSKEAVKKFNELVKKGKRVVLAIHLTC